MEVKRIESNKFKTNEIAVFLTVPLKRETITMNALLPAILRRGTNKLVNQIEIGKQLENMYGAFFNCGIDKTGNYCILRFNIATVSDRYIVEGENLAQKAMDLLLDIIFNPLTENGSFNKDYVIQEKENLKKLIESKKDNKQLYALDRGIEEMFKDEPYGNYKYGYLEDLDKIDEMSLYNYYKEMLQQAKINIIINGIDANKIQIPKWVNDGSEKFVLNTTNKPYQGDTKVVKEQLDVTQGKLIIGLEAPGMNKFAVSMYNAVLGGGANSKLFQNVREKASLAYSAGSRYIRRKDAIFIITGIELQNYEKALQIIQKQISDIKEGNVTDDEFEKAKQFVLATLNLIKESQDEIIAFEFDQDLFGDNLTVDEYMEEIKKIDKEQIIEVGKQIKINTIYFLEK